MRETAITLAFVAAFFCAVTGHALAGSQGPPKGPVQADNRGPVRTEDKAKRVGTPHVFSGRVEQVDVAARSFSVSNRGNRIGFDASNPIFTGYQSLSDVEIGDRVAVSYTTDGIRVTKLSAGRPSGRKGKAEAKEEPAFQAEKPGKAARRLIKIAKQPDPTGFSEADIKKDGKITPVGLSVVIKDVTMDEFKKYDKNHHGYLTKAEFLDAVKHLKTGDSRLSLLPPPAASIARRAFGHLFRPVLLLFLPFCLIPVSARAQHPVFAVVSDSHVGAPHSVYPSFIRAIEEAKIDMIIHTGDAINTPGSAREWASFLQITGPENGSISLPETTTYKEPSSLSVFLKYFPESYYSFSEGDTLFVLLNTELPGEESTISGEQLAWLKTELKRPFPYKFVFLHEPLFPVVPLHGLDRHRQERNRLHRLFAQSGVNLVIAGHDHIYDRMARDGITYVIAGPTGGTLPLS